MSLISQPGSDYQYLGRTLNEPELGAAQSGPSVAAPPLALRGAVGLGSGAFALASGWPSVLRGGQKADVRWWAARSCSGRSWPALGCPGPAGPV
jgi:hypothetical protein